MSVSSVTLSADLPRKWPPLQGEWTFADYERLPDNGKRYEIIRGELYMSPAPQVRHQRIIARLFARLENFLQKHPIGELFISPTDVRLSDPFSPNNTTNVQPDLFFVSQERLSIVEKNYINGSPDLVIEVISPRYETFDRSVKFDTYVQAGIREYWIVDPREDTIEVNVLRGTAYVPVAVFSGADVIRSEVLPELVLIAGDVFPAE